MPIPTIDFADHVQISKHDKIANQQKEMNGLYSEILKSGVRKKIVLERQLEVKQAEMDNMIKELFNLGDLDRKIPSVEDLYKSL